MVMIFEYELGPLVWLIEEAILINRGITDIMTWVKFIETLQLLGRVKDFLPRDEMIWLSLEDSLVIEPLILGLKGLVNHGQGLDSGELWRARQVGDGGVIRLLAIPVDDEVVAVVRVIVGDGYLSEGAVLLDTEVLVAKLS